MDLIVELYKTITKYCEENGYLEALTSITFLVLAIALIGAAVGWIIGRRGALATIYKTNAETSKIKADEQVQLATLLDRADERRTRLQENQREMDVLLKAVMETVRKGRVRILRDLRNDICELNSNVYMPALTNCIEDCAYVLPRKLGRQRIIGDIVPALRIQIKLYCAMNHKHFLDNIKYSQKYMLDLDARKRIFDAIRLCVPFTHFRSRRTIRSLEDQFIPHTKSNGT